MVFFHFFENIFNGILNAVASIICTIVPNGRNSITNGGGYSAGVGGRSYLVDVPRYSSYSSPYSTPETIYVSTSRNIFSRRGIYSLHVCQANMFAKASCVVEYISQQVVNKSRALGELATLYQKEIGIGLISTIMAYASYRSLKYIHDQRLLLISKALKPNIDKASYYQIQAIIRKSDKRDPVTNARLALIAKIKNTQVGIIDRMQLIDAYCTSKMTAALAYPLYIKDMYSFKFHTLNETTQEEEQKEQKEHTDKKEDKDINQVEEKNKEQDKIQDDKEEEKEEKVASRLLQTSQNLVKISNQNKAVTRINSENSITYSIDDDEYHHINESDSQSRGIIGTLLSKVTG